MFKYLDYDEDYSDDNWFFMLIRYLYREMNNKAFINPTIQDGVEVLPRVELNFDENSGNIAWNVAKNVDEQMKVSDLARTRYVLHYTTKDGKEESMDFISGLNAEDEFYKLQDDDNVISAKIENIYYDPKGVQAEFTRDENGEVSTKIY